VQVHCGPHPRARLQVCVGTKKGGTNGLAVRAGRPVTQLTSSFDAALLPPPSLEYIHHSIDWVDVKYKNRNFCAVY